MLVEIRFPKWWVLGIERKTNHSLRATGTTRMFKAGVPEKLIQQRTGHRSFDSLCVHERGLLLNDRRLFQKYSVQLKASITKVRLESVPVKPPGLPAGDGGFEFTSCQGCTFNFFNR